MAHIVFLLGSAALGNTCDMPNLWYLEICEVRSRVGFLGLNFSSPLHTCVALDKFYSSPSLSVLVCEMDRGRVAAALAGYEIACGSGWVKASSEYYSVLFADTPPSLSPRATLFPC